MTIFEPMAKALRVINNRACDEPSPEPTIKVVGPLVHWN